MKNLMTNVPLVHFVGKECLEALKAANFSTFSKTSGISMHMNICYGENVLLVCA